MIKILHGADFHLDSPFDALPEEKAIKRRSEQRALLDQMAQLANREKVDAVLLAGDLLDSDKSYHETGEALVSAFQTIKAPVFIAPGNHDYYHKRSPWAALRLPENVHVFTSPAPEAIHLPDRRGVIWGAAFPSSLSPSLLEGFAPIEDRRRPHAMALHGEIGGERYNPISPEQIAATGLTYLALGHEHSYSDLQKAGDTYYAYPGVPLGRGFDETGPGGVILAEIERDRVELRHVSLGGRQYHELAVDLSDGPEVLKAVTDALPPDTKRDIYRIVLKGEFDGRMDTEALANALEDRFFHVVFRDETRIRLRIWKEAEEDTLRGLFLRKMRDLYQRGDEEAKENIVLAIRYTLAAMEKGEQWRT